MVNLEASEDDGTGALEREQARVKVLADRAEEGVREAIKWSWIVKA